MEAKAQVRYLRMSPMKARRVVDLIRGKSTGEALDTLRFAPQAASEPVLKLVQSAIANARVKADQAGKRFDERELEIGRASCREREWVAEDAGWLKEKGDTKREGSEGRE